MKQHNVKWRNKKVHRLTEGINWTLCGISSPSMIATNEPVTCKICLKAMEKKEVKAK